jgi:hypothetical protein
MDFKSVPALQNGVRIPSMMASREVMSAAGKL